MKTASELWAIVDVNGAVLWSRGGSSSRRHLMVYPTEMKAEAALSNTWTRQVIPDASRVRIVRIYKVGTMPSCERFGGQICRSHGKAILVCHVDDCEPCSDHLMADENGGTGAGGSR